VVVRRESWRQEKRNFEARTSRRPRKSVNSNWRHYSRLLTAPCKTANIWNLEDMTRIWPTRRNSVKHTLVTAKDHTLALHYVVLCIRSSLKLSKIAYKM